MYLFNGNLCFLLAIQEEIFLILIDCDFNSFLTVIHVNISI